jgi:uncharacterized protein
MTKMIEDKMVLPRKGEVYLRVKVIPGAPKTEIKGEMADGTLKISVAAAPEKGRANQALVEFLAAEFGVPKAGIKIISGAGARIKLVKITRG